jgi:hypothetical protein
MQRQVRYASSENMKHPHHHHHLRITSSAVQTNEFSLLFWDLISRTLLPASSRAEATTHILPHTFPLPLRAALPCIADEIRALPCLSAADRTRRTLRCLKLQEFGRGVATGSNAVAVAVTSTAKVVAAIVVAVLVALAFPAALGLALCALFFVTFIYCCITALANGHLQQSRKKKLSTFNWLLRWLQYQKDFSSTRTYAREQPEGMCSVSVCHPSSCSSSSSPQQPLGAQPSRVGLEYTVPSLPGRPHRLRNATPQAETTTLEQKEECCAYL